MIQNYQIEFFSKPLLILTDGFLNLKDDYIYMQVVFCPTHSWDSCFNSAIRKIVRCLKNPINLSSDCEIFSIFDASNIYAPCLNFLNIHLLDRLLVSNSANQIFIGITETKNLDSKCSNSIVYGSPTNFGTSPNALNYVLPCDDAIPYYSYSKFLFVMSNDTIINIGLECREDNPICLNTYITIYSIFPNPFRYGLSKEKINIFPTNFYLSDGILSIDENYIYLLIKYGKFPIEICAIGIIDLVKISLIKSVNVIAVPDLIFPLSCYKILEFSPFQFILQCISIEYSINYRSVIHCCSYQKEIIYFIQRFNDIFSAKYYYDLYEEKFLNIKLAFSQYYSIMYVISSTIFFSVGYPDSANKYIRLNTPRYSRPIIINGISFVGQKYIYGGCILKSPELDFTDILFSFDSGQNYISEFSFNSANGESCIKDQISISNAHIVLTHFTKFSNLISKIKLIMINTSLNPIKTSEIYDSFYQEAPLILNPQNQILFALSFYNSSNLAKHLKILIYDQSLNLMSSSIMYNSHEVAASTLTLNLNNRITLGGTYFSNGQEAFWVGHYDLNNQLIINHILGKKASRVIGSSYLTKRIVGFYGIINKRSIVFQQNYPYYIYSSILFISDYGKFIKYLVLDEKHLVFSASLIQSETSIYLYGIQYDSTPFRVLITSSIFCSDPSFNIDQIELGCFKNCLANVLFDSSQQCNPSSVGCNSFGKIKTEEGYFCKKDNLMVKQQVAEGYSINIWANLIEYNNILVQLNESVISSFNVISILISNIKNRRFACLSFPSIDYSNNQFFFLAEPPTKCNVSCFKKIKISVSYMGLHSNNGYKVSPTELNVGNVTKSICNNSISALSKSIISISGSSSVYVSSFFVASNLFSFNPLGVVTLMNSIKELMTFQLLNCEPTYPQNINDFLNTNSFFSLNFLFNPIGIIFYQINFNNSDLYDNNIGFHSSLPSTSFVYNFMQTFTTILLTLLIILTLNYVPQCGHFWRTIKGKFQINYVINIYLSIFYQITISACVGLFFDNLNLDGFSFFSQLLAFIISVCLVVILIIFISLIETRKIHVKNKNEEFDYFFEELNEDLDSDDFSIHSNIIFNFKLQILISFAFIFQNHPQIQLASFLVIYMISLMLKIIFRPNQSISGNFHSILREVLLVLLTTAYNFYFYFILKQNFFFFSLPDSILVIMIFILLVEFIFTTFYLIIYIKDVACEKAVLSKIRKDELFQISQMEFRINLNNRLKTKQQKLNIKTLKMISPYKIRYTLQYNNNSKNFSNNLLNSHEKKDYFKSRIENPPLKVQNKITKYKESFIQKKLKKPTELERIKGLNYMFKPSKRIFQNRQKYGNEMQSVIPKMASQFIEGKDNEFYSNQIALFREDLSKKYPNYFKPQKQNDREIYLNMLPNYKSSKEETDFIQPNKNNKQPFDSKNEIIQIHVGRTGTNIGLELWPKLCIGEGISLDGFPFGSNLKTDNLNSIFFNTMKNRYEPRALFLDWDNQTINQIYNNQLNNLFKKDQYSLVQNKLFDELFFKDLDDKNEMMKAEIGKVLRIQLEKCNSLEGLFLYYSAGGTTGSYLGLLMHQLIKDISNKSILVDFPFYSISEKSMIPRSIMNEINTTSWVQIHSNLILPFLTESITKRLETNDMMEVPYKKENSLIADLFMLLTIPLRRRFNQSCNLNQLIQKLVTNDNHKFISSNIFLSENKSSYDLNDESAINFILRQQNLTGGSFKDSTSKTNLLIVEGGLNNKNQQYANLLIKNNRNDFEYEMDNNRKLIDIVSFDNSTGRVTKNRIRRMLYLSNSSSIIQLFNILYSKLGKLIQSEEFLQNNSNKILWSNRKTKSEELLASLIKYYEEI